jgi:hypothetical protein
MDTKNQVFIMEEIITSLRLLLFHTSYKEKGNKGYKERRREKKREERRREKEREKKTTNYRTLNTKTVWINPSDLCPLQKYLCPFWDELNPNSACLLQPL